MNLNVTDAKLKESFLRAYNVIKDEKNWTQYKNAKDSSGNSVNPCDDTATKWCSLGIIDKEFSENMHMHDLGSDLCSYFYNFTENKLLSIYNDTHTHSEILNLWTRVGNHLKFL